MSDQGECLQVLGDRVQIKLQSADSANQMTVMQITLAPGALVPPHAHAREEEAYYVLSGHCQFHLDGQERAVAPGHFLHVPAGLMHGYRNPHDQACQMLAWTVGGPIDAFFRAMDAAVKQLPDDLPRMPPILARFGISMAEPD